MTICAHFFRNFYVPSLSIFLSGFPLHSRVLFDILRSDFCCSTCLLLTLCEILFCVHTCPLSRLFLFPIFFHSLLVRFPLHSRFLLDILRLDFAVRLVCFLPFVRYCFVYTCAHFSPFFCFPSFFPFSSCQVLLCIPGFCSISCVWIFAVRRVCFLPFVGYCFVYICAHFCPLFLFPILFFHSLVVRFSFVFPVFVRYLRPLGYVPLSVLSFALVRFPFLPVFLSLSLSLFFLSLAASA